MKRLIPVLAVVHLFLGGIGQADAGIVVSVNSSTTSQASTVPGVTTETFNGFSTGIYTSATSTAVGTLSSGFAVVAANEFGGAGGSGNYFAVGTESGYNTATLTFSSPQAYFGFWWSAADAGNSLQLYSGTTLIASLNTATALGALGTAYNGNPNDRSEDSNEPFAYLNFTGTSGTTITSVVFTQTTAAGFEADNFSIYGTAITPPGTPISGGVTNNPEPSSLALITLGAIGLTGYMRRHRRPHAPRDEDSSRGA